MKKTALIIGLAVACLSVWASEPFKPNKEITGESKALFLASGEASIDFIYPVWGYYVDVSPGFSNISSDVAEHWNEPEGGLGYAVNIGYFRSLSPFFRISSGVGLSSVKSTLELKPENNEFSYKAEDIDGDSYFETISAKDFYEKTQPMYVSVPLIVEFGNPNIDKLGFYVNMGVRLSYLISDGYKNNGSYSAKGKYSQYQVTLKNIRELGFYNDEEVPDKSGSLKNLNTALQAGAGISIPLSSAMIFKAGVVTHWGVSDIGNSENSHIENLPEEHLRNDYFSENNSLTTNGKPLTRHFGVEFGLYINRLLK